VRDCERRDATVHRREAPQLARVGKPGEEALAELALPRTHRVEPDRAVVVDRRDEAGEKLVCERAGLVAVAERMVGGRTHLVRAPPLEQLGPAEREPEVRAAELVRGAEQDVGAGGADVDRPVRRPVHRVDPRERAGLVRELGDRGHVVDRPDRVRRPWEGDHPRPLGELCREIVEVERAVVADVDEAHDEALVARELEPRRDVPVVVEARHDDLVALAELARGRSGEREVERRHAPAEDRLVRRAAEPVGGREARVGDQRVRAPARLEKAARVRVRVAQVRRDRVDHLVRHLRPAGPVEERKPRAER
jgi:hypothetical protein